MTGRPTLVNARRVLVLRCGLTAIVIATFGARQLLSQAGLTRTEDAATVPRGVVRLRVVPSWSRFDSRFVGGRGGTTAAVPLAAVLAADSLGVAQIPALAASEQAIRTLSGDPTFRLSIGQSVARATSRIVTTVFAAEYGLTRRITLGAVLPLVQSRSDLFLAVNPRDATNANVGPNPVRPIAAQRSQAIALQSQLGTVRTTLQSRLAACDEDPTSDPTCPTIIANRADVQSLLTETAAFGSALGVLFGASLSDVTQPFAPLGTIATAIGTRLATLKERYRGYVGSTADEIAASVPFAAGPAAFGDIQRLLLQGDLALSPDSLDQVQRFNVGDLELGAKLLLIEHGGWPPSAGPSPWLRTRLSVQTIVRLGTGLPTLPRLPYRYLEYGTGDGQTDIEGAALLDLGFGSRIAIVTGARYTRQLGRVDAGRLPDEDGVINPFTPLFVGTRALGDILTVELTPRVLIGRFLAADAHFALLRRGDDEYVPADDATGTGPVWRGGYTEQRAGLGLSYSTMRGARDRDRIPRVPVEVSIAHIETIAGSSALVPRARRDQIELRVYYRVRPR